jgi:hypothetical protein
MPELVKNVFFYIAERFQPTLCYKYDAIKLSESIRGLFKRSKRFI